MLNMYKLKFSFPRCSTFAHTVATFCPVSQRSWTWRPKRDRVARMYLTHGHFTDTREYHWLGMPAKVWDSNKDGQLTHERRRALTHGCVHVHMRAKAGMFWQTGTLLANVSVILLVCQRACYVNKCVFGRSTRGWAQLCIWHARNRRIFNQ
jgi:hypothetical protein